MDTIKDIRSVTHLLVDTAVAFMALAICVLVFILLYLVVVKRIGQKNLQLANQFFQLVSEISLCESEEELEQVYSQAYVQDMQRTFLRKKKSRAFMITALLQFHKGIQGAAADNIKWLYQKLTFKNDALHQLSSRQWHKKAAAIQELAEMRQQDCITKIYRYTNHNNYYIRSTAQVAVVKLTGFEGLRFLNVISQPITQWQQVCLLQQLASDTNIKEEKLQDWLLSSNETVVELALKLVKAYAVHSVHDQLVQCLQHASVHIRTEAIMILKDVANATTASVLKAHYPKAEKTERMAILKVLHTIGTSDDISFLEKQLDTADHLLRNEIQKTLQELAPGWTNPKDTQAINPSKSRTVT